MVFSSVNRRHCSLNRQKKTCQNLPEHISSDHARPARRDSEPGDESYIACAMHLNRRSMGSNRTFAHRSTRMRVIH
jgi:hypothetical protein